jgi:2-keto-4-pentenoate hydratase
MTPVSYSCPKMATGIKAISEPDAAAIAQAFVQARQDRTAILQYPGERPANLAAAYAVQDCALGLANRAVGGWKVGRINAPADEALGANRLSGPIFTDTIVQMHGAQLHDVGPEMAIFPGGFAAGEAEFMLRIAPPARARRAPVGDTETLEWIDAARIGIEIASSPYARINVDGPCVTISDQGNNAGLVLGPVIEKQLWSSLNDIAVETLVAGQSVGRATAATMLDGPLGAVRFLVGNLLERGLTLEQGWWISTGAVTGVHPIVTGQTVTAKFDGIGEVSCLIV